MPRLLYIEDNEMNPDMLSRRLQRRGFEVMMAADGEQAMAMAAAEKPDLILMDMRLPVLDGGKRRLKAAPDTRRIPPSSGSRRTRWRLIGISARTPDATTMTPSRWSSGGFWKRASACSVPARRRA
jgi:hypothetical protein